MKYYLADNVFEAALKRIRWLFDEFPNVLVNFSGGKDSTVTLNLALQVAEEKGRLPLPVLFIDQEAEWATVIEYIRETMADPRVKPLWVQCPIKIFNATSTEEPWLMCWEPGREWMRPQEPIAITENVYGTDRFGEFFSAFLTHHFPDQPAVNLAGVRASESPARMAGLTSYATYKGETWGKVRSHERRHYDMYPLYDWADTDIWKAIHANRWPYCRVYDLMYQHGIAMKDMRVSNLHHETAIHQLFFLQEVEGATWERLVERLRGVNTAKHLQRNFLPPKVVPPMFSGWREYRDFLLDKLITNEEHRAYFLKKFAAQDRQYVEDIHDDLHKMHVASLLVNDYHGTKMTVFAASHGQHSRNRGKLSGWRGDGEDQGRARRAAEPVRRSGRRRVGDPPSAA